MVITSGRVTQSDAARRQDSNLYNLLDIFWSFLKVEEKFLVL